MNHENANSQEYTTQTLNEAILEKMERHDSGQLCPFEGVGRVDCWAMELEMTNKEASFMLGASITGAMAYVELTNDEQCRFIIYGQLPAYRYYDFMLIGEIMPESSEPTTGLLQTQGSEECQSKSGIEWECDLRGLPTKRLPSVATVQKFVEKAPVLSFIAERKRLSPESAALQGIISQDETEILDWELDNPREDVPTRAR